MPAVGTALRCLLLLPTAFARAQEVPPDAQHAQDVPPEPATVTRPAPQSGEPDVHDEAEATREPWIDRMHHALYWGVWRSAMKIDQFFGSEADAAAYQDVAGSLAPALLWDEFEGFQPKLRFRVKLPLPQLNERFDAFIGRVNRDEYVTEREQESGALPSQRGTPVEDDQTLLGLRYSDPKRRDRFSASGGVRVRTPLDPYVKASYRYQRGSIERGQLTLRETGFWQNSEDFGFTSRADLEGIWRKDMLLRATISGTISQESEGVRGYASLNALREFPRRRAAIVEIFASGEYDAEVPVRDYGIKVAYRKSVMRDWLVLELRTGVTWPKEERSEPRKPSWALGVGLEVFFGTEEFQARPVTF
jgi:hypothetical protein